MARCEATIGKQQCDLDQHDKKTDHAITDTEGNPLATWSDKQRENRGVPWQR